MRFGRKIIEGVRRRIGQGAVVGYRLGVEEFTEGGLTIDDTCEIAERLWRDGLVDYLSLSQGNFNTIETHLPDRHWPQMAYRDIQRRIKEAVGDLVVVQSTRIQTPEQAEDIIATGDGDMVGLCRALIVDPEWAKKAEEGRSDEIRRCIACNQCWDWISGGEPIACATNAVAGREHHFGKLKRAERAKIVIVGGGPAGLEAARVAAKRGHDVVLIERSNKLGGKFVHSARLPGNSELKHLTDFLEQAVRRLGVDIRLGVDATAQSVILEYPYAVILACGADPIVPAIPGDGSVSTFAATGPDELERLPTSGDNLVLMDEDGYFWSAGIAETAAKIGRSRRQTLTLATRFFEPLRELPMVSRIATLRELDTVGARIRTSMFVSRITGGSVVLKHALTGRKELVPGVAALIWVGAQSVRSRLYDELKIAGMDRTHLIGDAYAPRRLPVALFEAQTIARAV